MARAIAQLKVAELSPELLSELEILYEQDEDVAEAALPLSEAYLEGTLDLDFEEELDIEYSEEGVYLSEDDLELDKAVPTAL
jgi:hypothetical protein